MKHLVHFLFPILSLSFSLGVSSPAQTGGLYDAVAPMIGTSNSGMAFPGASLPFGMIQWSPETENGYYVFKDKRISGFSLTHLSGVGCPIFADVPVLPWTGSFDVSPGKDLSLYAVPFDHTTEQAHPGYYTVTLGSGVKVELTVDERSGIASFRFPKGSPARLLVNTSDSYIYQCTKGQFHSAWWRPGKGRQPGG